MTTALLTTDAAAEMYKWTDKNGETHYTQTPPPPDAKGENIEDDIRLSTGKLGNTIPTAPAEAPKDGLEQAREEGEKSDQKHREFCAQQNDALQKMTANAIIKWKDAKGERFLTAEEKASKTQEVQKNIDSLCKPEMFNKSEKSSGQTKESSNEPSSGASPNTPEANQPETNQSADASSSNNSATSSGNAATNQAATAMLPAAD
ncbi:MAG: hypothetical protein BWK73_09430 [Thiothrix lacustris]|uniref:DUF4124 domain-containing protein n=1 Tax=Thiothrix lacustris TaxID=525917 RepID=A0A1Y1QVK5_9GAMM|nr:MAG: hypothetical protein BWK73_09430 [Thiothrix lacustris]